MIKFETWEMSRCNTGGNKAYVCVCVCVCVCVFEDRSEPSILSSMCKRPEVGRNLVHLINSKV